MPTEPSQEAWEQGFAAGLLCDNACPYFAGTDDALTWLSGWIEGERIRLVQIARHTRPAVVSRTDSTGPRQHFWPPRQPATATGPERMAACRSSG